MEQVTLAYLAGIIDADGTIGVKRSTYAARVTRDCRQPTYSERIVVRQVQPEAIELLKETFGGYVGISKPSSKKGRPLFHWSVTDKKAASALAALLPFLRIKKRQAENCLKLREVKEQSKRERVAKGRGHVGSAARTKGSSSKMEALFVRAKELNKTGVAER